MKIANFWPLASLNNEFNRGRFLVNSTHCCDNHLLKQVSSQKKAGLLFTICHPRTTVLNESSNKNRGRF